MLFAATNPNDAIAVLLYTPSAALWAYSMMGDVFVWSIVLCSFICCW